MSENQHASRPAILRIVLVAGLLILLLTNPQSVRAQSLQRSIVSRTRPEYPELAIRMHISGSVHVVVSIEPNGTVKSVHATSGHAFLQGPAEQAVRQWRFSKAPVASDTTVEVQFALNPHS